ncbi:MAG: endonuclease/exonuclease/phosphatase family protein [Rhodospirillales bacterium]
MPPDRRLSIVTLNTWKGDGEYRVRLRLMAEGLAALDADIILLQECFSVKGGEENTAQHLAATLGLNGFYQPVREKRRVFDGKEVSTFSGLAVLSRFASEPVGAIELPSDPADGQRAAQFISVDADGGSSGGAPILIANTHLTHLPEADDLRTKQMQTIVKRIREDQGHGTVVLGGDFNATPDKPVIRWLTGLRNLRAIDAGAAGAGNKPKPTKLEKEGEYQGKAIRRLDYLFLINRVPQPQYSIVSSDVVLDKPDPLTGLFPSDHAAVRVVLRPISGSDLAPPRRG